MSLERCVALFFLVISLIYGLAAFNYPLLPFERNMAFLPNTMPMVLSVLGTVLSLLLLLSTSTAPEQPSETTTFARPHIVQTILLLTAMVVFSLSLRPVGFLLSTCLFLVCAGFILGERKLHIMIPIAAISAFSIWYLVQEVLGIFMRPWPGFIG